MTDYRYSVINALGDLPDNIIQEAEIQNSSLERSKVKYLWAQISSFMNSGWGVAILCAVVSLAIFTGILHIGRIASESPHNPKESEGISGESETTDVTETEAETEDPYLYWDGSIAKSFGGGNGTSSSPYLIKNAGQLAYLSYLLQCENSNYQGKYYRLEADLDLRGKSWDPIGQGNFPFTGVFDGNGHTIRNMYVSEAVYGIKVTGGFGYVAGLFGYVKGGTIKNLTLMNPEIFVKYQNGNLDSAHSVYAGMLAARWNAGEQDAFCYNCDVINAELNVDIVSSKSVYAGDMIGYIEVGENGRFEGEQLQCLGGRQNITNANHIYQGVLCGYTSIKDELSLRDICMEGRLYAQYRAGKEYNGVVGAVNNVGGRLTVRNMWANIKNSHVLSGDLFTCQVFGTADHKPKFNFKNAFGHNSVTSKTDIIYYAVEEYVTLTNCAVVNALPDNHGFDKDVWDLSDLSSPRLK